MKHHLQTDHRALTVLLNSCSLSMAALRVASLLQKANLTFPFKEWGAYGAGLPLVMNGSESVVQYYVPYLSGIQLYVDRSKPPFKTRHLGEETDLDPSQEASTDGSDSENIERCVKLGLRGQKSLAESRLVTMDRLSLSEKPHHIQESFSNDDGKSASSSLAFEYMERDSPYSREPLAEKANYVSFLMWSSFADREIMTRYPIYRIPTGPTLRDLEACFLMYQKLPTPSIGVSNSRVSFSTVKKIVNSADMSHKLSLRVFGLASYKFLFGHPIGLMSGAGYDTDASCQ